MSEWVWLRQIRITTHDHQVIVQPWVYVWWTFDENELLIDCQTETNTPDFLADIRRPTVMTIPLDVIKKIEIWIQQGKEHPEKHVILDNNKPPVLNIPIIQS